MGYFNKSRMNLALIGLPIIMVFIALILIDSQLTDKEILDLYENKEYSGIIINKYIDLEEHMNKKIIIKGEYVDRTILFNNESSGVFDFLQIGDSIIKKSESLEIQVFRDSRDTTLKMKFH
ncbi:MAG: hypothetical protein WD607_00260 [Candidatus Paceibacterota bacterium]